MCPNRAKGAHGGHTQLLCFQEALLKTVFTIRVSLYYDGVGLGMIYRRKTSPDIERHNMRQEDMSRHAATRNNHVFVSHEVFPCLGRVTPYLYEDI